VQVSDVVISPPDMCNVLSLPTRAIRQDARLMYRLSCKNSAAGAAFTLPRADDKLWLRNNVALGYSTRLAS
jgi:hypothetical protein